MSRAAVAYLQKKSDYRIIKKKVVTMIALAMSYQASEALT